MICLLTSARLSLPREQPPSLTVLFGYRLTMGAKTFAVLGVEGTSEIRTRCHPPAIPTPLRSDSRGHKAESPSRYSALRSTLCWFFRMGKDTTIAPHFAM